MSGGELEAVLESYRPGSEAEARDVERVRQLVRSSDPWDRSLPLHVTGSAIVVHPESRRVLLRWHDRLQSWLQVGGHGDSGESDPLVVARREAREETGLTDLTPWPVSIAPTLVQVAIVAVPAGRREPAHEHADLRYVLATARPEEARPEKPSAQVRWLTIDDAVAAVVEDNLGAGLRRVGRLLDSPADSSAISGEFRRPAPSE